MFWALPAESQTFVTILEKIDKIDNRLKSIETAQQKDITRLQNNIVKLENKVSGAQNSNGSEELFADLKSQIEQLAAGLDEVKKQNGGSSGKEEELNSLAADLKDLIGELRTTLETNGNGTEEEANAETETTPVEFEESDVPGGPVPETEQLLSLGGDGVELAAIEITGFGDFSRVGGSEEENSYQFGQVEVDLETNIDERIVIAAAIAFDPGSETFGMGAFTVDFRLFGSEEGHFKTHDHINTSGIVVGQFDVPFGLDWMVYPSIDRKLVSGPLAIENQHDYWNDYGIQGYIDTKWFNAVAFGTNGFGYDEVEMKMALGGRVGLKPHEFVEVGSSYASFLNEDERADMQMLGFDLQFGYQAFSFKGEYILREHGLNGDEKVRSDGYYAQGMYDFGKYFVVSRYGKFTPVFDGEEHIARFTGGLGYVLTDGCELRFEYQANENAGSLSFMQLVVGF
ncbi:hypothetical protein ACFL6O_04605 [candidate division KSB1 bacterium]